MASHQKEKMMMPNVTQIAWTFKITSISQCCFPRFPCENYETLLLKEERQQKKSQRRANSTCASVKQRNLLLSPTRNVFLLSHCDSI